MLFLHCLSQLKKIYAYTSSNRKRKKNFLSMKLYHNKTSSNQNQSTSACATSHRNLNIMRKTGKRVEKKITPFDSINWKPYFRSVHAIAKTKANDKTEIRKISTEMFVLIYEENLCHILPCAHFVYFPPIPSRFPSCNEFIL